VDVFETATADSRRANGYGDEPFLGELFSGIDLDRARLFADSVARICPTLDDTLALADRALAAGLAAIGRGDDAGACHELSRSLIASSLAAWQHLQLMSEATAHRDFETAGDRKSAMDALLAAIPGRVRIAAGAFFASPTGARCPADLRGTLLAFVVGSGVWHLGMTEPTRQRWLRAVLTAFEREPAQLRRTDVSSLGVPSLTTHCHGAACRMPGRRNHRQVLSNREREVLSLIVAGYNTHETADRLGIKTTTVSTLVGRIFNKLGVNNRPAAVAIALRQGLCGGIDHLAA
jgi:DNA-binding CsgD family transcriptional regulator